MKCQRCKYKKDNVSPYTKLCGECKTEMHDEDNLILCTEREEWCYSNGNEI